MDSIISVDGSLYEGGGQIIRLSLGLSVLCQKPVHIFNIRSGRSSPGLAESHLVSVNTIAQITNSQVQGNHKGSAFLQFFPGQVKSGNYNAVCSTAGSTNLILQAVLPILIKTNSILTITGGTDTDFSPPSFQVLHVFQPALHKIGVKCEIYVEKHGFYPKGQGKIVIRTEPSVPQSLNLSKVTYLDMNCSILLTGKGKSEKLSQITSQLSTNLDLLPEKLEIHSVNSKDSAIVVSLFCNTDFVPLHTSFIENFRNSSYNIPSICDELKTEIASGHTIDSQLQDQLLVFLALAPEPSTLYTTRLTPHTEAVMYLLNLFQIAQVSFENCTITVRPINT